MLATSSRLAPRAVRRALTTTSAQRAPLAPPYSHEVRSALAPPYTHTQPAPTDEPRLQAPYAFALNHKQPAVPTPQEWIAATLDTDAGRQWAQGAWAAALAEMNSQPASAPEIPFQTLTEVLADPTVAALAARAGAVVVRDVVRDVLAESWAAELLAAREARTEATYHHQAQVSARADPSVLSATSQVLRALVPGAPEPTYVRVDAFGSAPTVSTWGQSSLWAVDESASPATPVHAHLALARTELRVPLSAHSALYALLRPYFAAEKSRISFYSADGYLAPENWRLRSASESPDADADLVHVRPATVDLAPGDILLTHAGAPLRAADESGLLQPVHPLPATEGNRAFTALQRAAFEAGMPPPHAPNPNTPVALEAPGDASCIGSWGGRRAMGYGN